MGPDVVVKKFNPNLSERRCTDAPTTLRGTISR
jgi:hypothetical protein